MPRSRDRVDSSLPEEAAAIAPDSAAGLLLEIAERTNQEAAPAAGPVVAVVVGRDGGRPLVQCRGATEPRVARTVVPIGAAQVGREAVVVFEGGDASRPIIMGLLEPEAAAPEAEATASEAMAVERDGERVVIEAERELVLRCGKASITLTRAGKILIRGAYVSSRSTGVNRILGGSVEIN